MNLREVVNLLPRTIANRYDDAFWVESANEVLSDVSNRGYFSWNIKHSYMPFDPELLAVELPEQVRAVTKVRDQGANPLPFEVQRKVLEFAKGVYVDSTTTQVATVVSSFGALRTVLDIPVGHSGFAGWSVNTDNFESALVKYARQVSPTTLEIGHTEQIFPVGSTVTLNERWVAVEWMGSFFRINDALEDIMANHHLFKTTLKLGLWYMAMRHINEAGDEANTRLQEYLNSIEDWYANDTRRTFKQKPRFGWSKCL